MRIVVPALIGLYAGLMASAALAETNHFLGRWHWNKAQSQLAPGEPAPQDVKSSIVSADGGQIKWTADLTDDKGKRHIETFNGKPDGTFYPVVGAGADVTASFTWSGATLQSAFKSAGGGSDTQTCSVSADDKQMTCRGTWTDRNGKSANYVDVYDRT